jgi:hypothetical protein
VPSEIRYGVYDFLFGDATFIISNTTEFKQLLRKRRTGIVTEDDEKEIKENSTTPVHQNSAMTVLGEGE